MIAVFGLAVTTLLASVCPPEGQAYAYAGCLDSWSQHSADNGQAVIRPGLPVNKLNTNTKADLQPCCSPVIVVLWVLRASLDGP